MIRMYGELRSSKANPHQKSTNLLGLVPAYVFPHCYDPPKAQECDLRYIPDFVTSTGCRMLASTSNKRSSGCIVERL